MSIEVVSHIRSSSRDVGLFPAKSAIYKIDWDTEEVATCDDLDEKADAADLEKLERKIDSLSKRLQSEQNERKEVQKKMAQVEKTLQGIYEILSDKSRIKNETSILEKLFSKHIAEIKKTCHKEASPNKKL